MATIIKGSVGQHGKNMLDDVRVVQYLLNLSAALIKPLQENGICTPATINAITSFQKEHSLKMDGRVDPSGATIVSLLKRAKAALACYSENVLATWRSTPRILRIQFNPVLVSIHSNKF